MEGFISFGSSVCLSASSSDLKAVFFVRKPIIILGYFKAIFDKNRWRRFHVLSLCSEPQFWRDLMHFYQFCRYSYYFIICGILMPDPRFTQQRSIFIAWWRNVVIWASSHTRQDSGSSKHTIRCAHNLQ